MPFFFVHNVLMNVIKEKLEANNYIAMTVNITFQLSCDMMESGGVLSILVKVFFFSRSKTYANCIPSCYEEKSLCSATAC